MADTTMIDKPESKALTDALASLTDELRKLKDPIAEQVEQNKKREEAFKGAPTSKRPGEAGAQSIFGKVLAPEGEVPPPGLRVPPRPRPRPTDTALPGETFGLERPAPREYDLTDEDVVKPAPDTFGIATKAQRRPPAEMPRPFEIEDTRKTFGLAPTLAPRPVIPQPAGPQRGPASKAERASAFGLAPDLGGPGLPVDRAGPRPASMPKPFPIQNWVGRAVDEHIATRKVPPPLPRSPGNTFGVAPEIKEHSDPIIAAHDRREAVRKALPPPRSTPPPLPCALQGAQPPPLPSKVKPPPLPRDVYGVLPMGQHVRRRSRAQPPPLPPHVLTVREQTEKQRRMFPQSYGGGNAPAPPDGGSKIKYQPSEGPEEQKRPGPPGGEWDTGGAMGKAAAAFYMIEQAVGKSARAIDVMGNSALTTAHQEEEVARLLVPGATALIAFKDAVTGVTDSLRRADVAYKEAIVRVEGQARITSVRDATAAEMSTHATRAEALRGLAIAGAMPVAPKREAGFAGLLAHEEATARYPHQVGLARAKAEHGAAQMDLAAGQRRYTQLQHQSAFYVRRANQTTDTLKTERQKEQAPGWLGSNRNKVAVDAAAIAALEAQRDLGEHLNRMEAEGARLKALGVTEAQKESAVRKQNIAGLQAELSLLQQKEKRASSEAGAVGRLSEVKQQQGLHAARQIKLHGIQNVPMQMRESARSVAAEYVREQEEKYGANTGVARSLREEGFNQKQTAEQVRLEMPRVQTELNMKVVLDEAALAEKIGPLLGAALEKLVTVMEVRMRKEVNELRLGLIRGGNRG